MQTVGQNWNQTLQALEVLVITVFYDSSFSLKLYKSVTSLQNIVVIMSFFVLCSFQFSQLFSK